MTSSTQHKNFGNIMSTIKVMVIEVIIKQICPIVVGPVTYCKTFVVKFFVVYKCLLC